MSAEAYREAPDKAAEKALERHGGWSGEKNNTMKAEQDTHSLRDAVSLGSNRIRLTTG